MKTSRLLLPTVVIMLLSLCPYDQARADDGLTPVALRCEYLVDPLGIGETKPRLSWRLESNQRGQRQIAYQLLVAGSREKLGGAVGDLWDTRRVSSDRSTQVVYNGKPLSSRMRCYWKVRVWGKDGKVSPWSKPAIWSMGLLNSSEWKAQWIGHDVLPPPEEIVQMPIPGPKGKGKTKRYLPSPYFRKEFSASRPIVRALLYVTAQGLVEMHLNGHRVGDEYFTPGWTDYRKRIYYRTYDVTEMLRQGSNAIGAILGDGWFRGNISILGQNRYGKNLRLMCQLHIDYADGTSETIVSDPCWKASFGPILLSDMQEGETYDARKEIAGWNLPGFDETGWTNVVTGSDITPQIQSYPGVPVRPTQELPTVKLTEPKPGVWVFDLGQNFSGFARLKVRGNAGDKVTMQFAEMLNADGTVYTENLRSARAADNYILKGTGEEVWQPHFTFHGFRYVQVTGLSEKPTPETITGVVLHSDAPMTSSFECSDPMLNQLYSNILWGQRSNYLEVPTDCPQRDERLGWTGDTQVFIRTGCYNQDVAAFFTKWIVDLMDTQTADGVFGQQAPVFHGHGSPAWADAGIICPWTIYKVYGDKRLISRHYDAMAQFIESCRRKGLNGRGGGFGDWLAVGSNTPKDVISAAYFAYSTSLMAEMAEALGKEKDAAKYRRLFEGIRKHFQESFVGPDGTIAGDSQTAYCLALHFNLLTDRQRGQAAAHLVDRIKAKDYHLSVGFVGVPILLPTLTEIGRSDLAYRLICNKTYPSWGYSIEQGATTIWERWNSYTKKDGFGNPGMNSFNHYAYGSCGEWIFRSMLGIDTDGPGFKRIIMRPEIGHGITWAKGHYDSIHGHIRSDWRDSTNAFHWKITIPAGTTATVYVPASKLADITESGVSIDKAEGVAFLRMEDDRVVLTVDSGSYDFTATKAQTAQKTLPIEGDVFSVEGRTAFLILPKDTSTDKPIPWVWYAPTLKGLPGKEETWMFEKFLAAGIAIAGVDVGESYGSPKGRAVYSALHKELVENRGLAKRACLLARSRGGLMLYCWAAEHPESVACVAGIYPVCNLSSYPGLKRACGAYGMTEQQLAQALAKHNPINRLAPLAKAKVPIYHIHGDRDTVVPLELNSAELARRYTNLGGRMTLDIIEGQGHNMWTGWFHSQKLVDFVIRNAKDSRNR